MMAGLSSVLKSTLPLRGAFAVQTLLSTKVIPSPPKRPPSAYLRFLKDRRTLLLNENPNLKPLDLFKIIGSEWKLLDDHKRDLYQQEYKKDWEDYVKQKQTYVSSLTEEDITELEEQKEKKRGRKLKMRMKAKLRELDMPKPPQPPFSIFINENHMSMKGMKISQVIKNFVAEWKTLSEDQRQAYTEKYKEQRVKWQEDFLKWIKNVQKAGHQDVLDYLAKNKTLPRLAEESEMKPKGKGVALSEKTKKGLKAAEKDKPKKEAPKKD